jgi:hypothetical protein
MPAKCSPVPDDMIAVSSNEIDLGVAVLFLRLVASQIHVRVKRQLDLPISDN